MNEWRRAGRPPVIEQTIAVLERLRATLLQQVQADKERVEKLKDESQKGGGSRG